MSSRRMAVGALFALAAGGLAPAYGQRTRRTYRIGLHSSSGTASMVPFVRALWSGLGEFGYEEGKNMTLEARYAAGDLSRLPELAHELVALKPDAILPIDFAAELPGHDVRTVVELGWDGLLNGELMKRPRVQLQTVGV